MSTTRTKPPVIGRCPNCHAEIASYDVLIEYEADGVPAIWAGCPDCDDVVHPR